MQEILFQYKGMEHKGLLLQEQNGSYMIKLASGYNIIVPVCDVQIEKSTEFKTSSSSKVRIRQENTLPLVSILHTGGTIASRVDYTTGAVVAQFDPDDLIASYPQLLTLASVESKLIRNMMSDDMRFAHYNILARAVLEEIVRGTQGVIITQGTDTLHYTAAALSFALEGLNIPVVIVGSQRSSDRGSTDAAGNLLGALRFILTKAPGVYVAMHEGTSDDAILIIDGLHARKQHSSARGAFVSINARPIARVVNDTVNILDEYRLAQWHSHAALKPSVVSFDEHLRIGWWKSHPQSSAEELVVFEQFDGLLLEGTGLGHLPISSIDEFTAEHARIREMIEKLAKRIPVAMSTQTIAGRVNMDVYSPGRTLQELGVLGQNSDMMPEVAYIKLAWLLSQTRDLTKLREQFTYNYRGELSERSEFF